MALVYATGGLLGTALTGQDIGVTADNGTVIYPHAPNTITHFVGALPAGRGIAVYGITGTAGVTASASCTVGVSGTTSAGGGGSSFVSLNTATAPADVGIWAMQSATFPA